MNSFKSKLYISDAPFQLPKAGTYVALTNYFEGVRKTGFFSGVWKVSVYYGLLRSSNCTVYLHDGMVHYQSEIEI